MRLAMADSAMTYEFQGVEYLLGSAGSLILACQKCGDLRCRTPENYFWSLVPLHMAWIEQGKKNYWGDPSWHKCYTCGTQMEPIRADELESRWKPFWDSLDPAG
jgi:hypothetical protein